MEIKTVVLGWILTWLTSCARVYSVNVTICTIVVKNGRQPFDYLKSGPAVDIALEKLPGILGPGVNVDFVYRDYGPDCVANHVGAISAELYYTKNVTAFIGTGCSVATQVVARLAASWNLPIITPVSTAGYLNVKADFYTLTRLSYNMNKFANFYIQIFKHFRWKNIAIIHDVDYIFHRIVGDSLTVEFKKVGLTVFTQPFETYSADIMVDLLRQASARSRVILLACYGDTLREMMLTAQKLGMTSGEYVFIFIRLFKGDNLGDTSWRRNDDDDDDARRAYDSVLVMQPRRPETTEYLEFERDVKLRAERDYNFTYGEDEVHLFISSFHDAFIMYATVLKSMLDNGEDFMDGRLVTSKIWNHTFYGIAGAIVIDETGDREIDFSMLDVDPVSGDYQVVANYLGILRRVVFSNTSTIHWPQGQPPVNRPRCGYTGDDPICNPPAGLSTLALMGIIFACAIVILCIVVFLAYRRMKSESDLNSQWWKVKWSDVSSVNAGSVIGSGRLSMDAASVKIAMARDLVMYKGSMVVVKPLKLKSVKMSRQALIEMKQMRDVTCPNLSRFYGMCIGQPHIAILDEHCTRGSLRDMLHNESIKLDRDFKLSLMNDIIEGMFYIHNSPLSVHGRLNSDSCRIDGRFVLKLTNFGIPSIREQQQEGDSNKHDLLWVAPEILRHQPPRPTTQQGDIYSFAIVLCEVFTRSEPYEDDLESFTIEAVVSKIMEDSMLYRPPLNLVDESQLQSLIVDCWQANPALRPAFNVIRKRHRALSGKTGYGQILDTLLKRMEQYADNLEGLVEERTQAFLEEKKRSEQLLYQVLPKSVADKLKNGMSVDAETFESVTIYFSDIVGFTSISADSTAMQVVDLLNDIYTCFDRIIENYDVYKVETIGDAYMVVSGLPIRNGDEHVRQIARMSLSILANLKEIKIRHLPDRFLRARIGLNTGPVCAGVVGLKMPRYCLFGDTVNTASRMESNGEAMKIHVSESTMLALRTFDSFVMEARGGVQIKGKGLMETYWLLGELPLGSKV